MMSDGAEEAGSAKPSRGRFWTITIIASSVAILSTILLVTSASKTSSRTIPFLSNNLKGSTTFEEPAEPITILEEEDSVLGEKRDLYADCIQRGFECRPSNLDYPCCEEYYCNGVTLTCEEEEINCFSAEAIVVGRTGPIRMKDLRVGDEVWTGKQFQPVYSFAHKHSDKPTNYLSLKTTASKTPLEVTADHLLYVSDKQAPVRAADIQVGDKLVGFHQDTDVATVLQVKPIIRNGLYAPLTADGMVVVNNVLSSNYVNYGPFHALSPYVMSYGMQHRYQHAAWFPYRMFCSLVGCENESMDEATGYSKYGSLLMQLVDWLGNHVSLLLAGLYLVVAPVDWLLESNVFEQLGVQVVLRTFVLLFVVGPLCLLGWLVTELVKNPMHLGAGLAGVWAWKKWSSGNGGKGNKGPQKFKK